MEPRGRRAPKDRTGPRREPRPMPIGDRCNPLCPFFRCAKKALRINKEFYRGRPIRMAMCNWIGDKCVGAECRFAFCEKRAMLPDGRCAFAVKGKKMEEFEDELKRDSGIKLRGKIKFDEDMF